MDSSKYVDSKGNVIKIGDRVKFKAHYGYQRHKTMESEGVVVGKNEYGQIDIKLGHTYQSTGRGSQSRQTDKFTLFGNYDYKRSLMVFGCEEVICQFDMPTVLNEYCLIQGEE